MVDRSDLRAKTSTGKSGIRKEKGTRAGGCKLSKPLGTGRASGPTRFAKKIIGDARIQGLMDLVDKALKKLEKQTPSPRRIGTGVYYIILGKVLEQLMGLPAEKGGRTQEVASLSKIIYEQKRAETRSKELLNRKKDAKAIGKVPEELEKIVRDIYGVTFCQGGTEGEKNTAKRACKPNHVRLDS